MSRSRRAPWRLILVAVGIIAFVWTVVALDPEKVWAVARDADPWWLAASALPIGLRFIIWGVKWNGLLRGTAKFPLRVSTRIIAAGSFVNLTTPTAKLAGGIVRAALIHRRFGWRLSKAYGWAFADQVTNLLGQGLLLGAGSLAFAAHPAAGDLWWAFAILGTATLAAIGLAILLRNPFWNWIRQPQWHDRLERFVPRRFVSENGIEEGLLERIFGPLLIDSAAWKRFIPAMLWGGIAFATLPVANAMVLKSLGVDAPLLVVTVIVVLGYLAGNLLGAWGGIGVTEAALATLGAQFGVPAEQAAAGALLHRAIFYLVVLAWGGKALWKEGRISLSEDGEACEQPETN